MLTEPITKNQSVPATATLVSEGDRALRELAIKQVERIRTFAHRPPTEAEIEREIARLKSRA